MKLSKQDAAKIQSKLQLLVNDCQMQVDAISDQTESWDVYDLDNWTGMVYQLRDIAQILEIQLDDLLNLEEDN